MLNLDCDSMLIVTFFFFRGAGNNRLFGWQLRFSKVLEIKAVWQNWANNVHNIFRSFFFWFEIPMATNNLRIHQQHFHKYNTHTHILYSSPSCFCLNYISPHQTITLLLIMGWLSERIWGSQQFLMTSLLLSGEQQQGLHSWFHVRSQAFEHNASLY